MATYAIGDLQGCFDAFQALLAKIHFKPKKDTLWLTGDLINRGSKSLETLAYLYEHRESIVTVLGNHDISMLAVYFSHLNIEHDCDALLQAKQADTWFHWLIQQPLMHRDKANKLILVHAGIYPNWSLSEAETLAKEVEALFQGAKKSAFLKSLFGPSPLTWTKDLAGTQRHRFIVNAFTRMRYLSDNNLGLNLIEKGPLGSQSDDLIPWFHVNNPALTSYTTVIGHWASLDAKLTPKNIIALDTGCVWGNQLTAYRFEDQKRFVVACQQI